MGCSGGSPENLTANINMDSEVCCQRVPEDEKGYAVCATFQPRLWLYITFLCPQNSHKAEFECNALIYLVEEN